MFTDMPVTPLHVESLLGFLRANSSKKFTREDIRGSFQSPSIASSQTQSTHAISAALELKLCTEGAENRIELLPIARGKTSPNAAVREALDVVVLGSTDVEDYLALFYSYMLGLNDKAMNRTREEWVLGFNRDVFDNKPQPNQFNTTKLTGLHRWLAYMGLGWYDQGGQFICNPYARIHRQLGQVFGKDMKLECEEFLGRLASECPELDGGTIFLQAYKRYDKSAQQCTLGLSHALIDLHLDGALTLHCPKDSDGWSIALAGPPSDGKTLASDRVSQVELARGRAK